MLRAFTAVVFLAYTNFAGASLIDWAGSGTDGTWTFTTSVTADVTAADAGTNTWGDITAWSVAWTDGTDSYTLDETTGAIRASDAIWMFDASFVLANPPNSFLFVSSTSGPSLEAQFRSDVAAGNPPGVGVNMTWTDGVAASVPAPATLALFGLGLAGLGWSRRKKA